MTGQSNLNCNSTDQVNSSFEQNISLNENAASFDLREVADAIWRRRLSLLLWLILCLFSGIIYLVTTPTTFTAAATVILEPRQTIGTPISGSQTAATQALDVAQAESQIQVIRSERILSTVFDVLNLKDAIEVIEQRPGLRGQLLAVLGLNNTELINPTDQRAKAFQVFSERVGVRRLGASYVLEVSYQAESPEQAARVANAIAVQYIKMQIDVKAAAAIQGAEYLRGRITNLEAEQKAAAAGVREGRIPDMLFSDADARVIGAALPPLGKSYPKGGLIIAFALTFGLVTGLLFVAAQQATDRTLNTRRQVRKALRVNCLGILQYVPRGKNKVARRANLLPLASLAVDRPASSFSLGLRSIRTAILLNVAADRRWAIGIASWSEGEGCSTVAINLAHIMSAQDNAVDLIDADLHVSALTKVLAPNAPIGLADVLMHSTTGLAHPSVALSASLGFVPAAGAGRNSDPNLYLGSESMQDLLKQMLGIRNLIVDLPPLNINSDAVAVSRHLDGIVLVVEANLTTIDEAIEAINAFQTAHVKVFGIILNKTRSSMN